MAHRRWQSVTIQQRVIKIDCTKNQIPIQIFLYFPYSLRRKISFPCLCDCKNIHIVDIRFKKEIAWSPFRFLYLLFEYDIVKSECVSSLFRFYNLSYIFPHNDILRWNMTSTPAGWWTFSYNKHFSMEWTNRFVSLNIQ